MKKRIEKLEQRIKPARVHVEEYDLSDFTVEELRYLVRIIENGEELTPEMEAKLHANRRDGV